MLRLFKIQNKQINTNNLMMRSLVFCNNLKLYYMVKDQYTNSNKLTYLVPNPNFRFMSEFITLTNCCILHQVLKTEQIKTFHTFLNVFCHEKYV